MDPGFTLRQGLLASVDLLAAGYDEPRGLVLFDRLTERVAALPHVVSASVARSLPLDLSSGSDMGIDVDGCCAPSDDLAWRSSATPFPGSDGRYAAPPAGWREGCCVRY